MYQLLFALLLSAYCVLSAAAPPASAEPEKVFTKTEIEKLQTAANIIKTFYVTDPQAENLAVGAVKGMAANLDENSEYLTPFEYDQLEIEAQGNFVGIGIILRRDGEYPEVVHTIENSPADKEGVLPGDKIITVNGKSTRQLSLNRVIKSLKDEPATSVKLEIYREGTGEKEIELIREQVFRSSLGNVFQTKDRIGYLECLDFTERTPREILETLIQMQENPVQGLVLDLRRNAGGVFEAGIETAGLFLNTEAPVVYTKGRRKEDNQSYRIKEAGPFLDTLLVVLVDGQTASAAEILAGALQDNARALLIGARTYGKASVQTIFPMEDGSALRLTTAYYYTPNGKVIEGRGILPDIELSSDEDLGITGATGKPVGDPILEHALNIIRKQLQYATQKENP